jgi:hypothetical protein
MSHSHTIDAATPCWRCYAVTVTAELAATDRAAIAHSPLLRYALAAAARDASVHGCSAFAATDTTT